MPDYVEVDELGRPERAILVGLQQSGETFAEAQASLAELERLVATAGADVMDTRVINLRNPNPATFISKGFLDELTGWVELKAPELVVLDSDFSPAQQRNLEKAFDRRVLTRTEVILDIFATHAHTREAMTQVELAQMRYRLPRLVGASIATARMGGASSRIATRGPGETQLEVDRRRVRERINHLEEILSKIEKQRATQRQQRLKTGLPLVAIVGYTNAGKSTLLNRLTNAGVLVEDRLFATLDTTVRNLRLPGGLEVGLIDTVGFVNKLPKALVAAFRSTLEEARFADLILQVVDTTSLRPEVEYATTEEILETIGCKETARLTVWNKVDIIEDPIEVNALSLRRAPSVAISALTGRGIDEMMNEIERMLMQQGMQMMLLVPFSRYDLVARIHREGQVLESRQTEEGTLVRARLNESLQKAMEEFRIEEWPEE